MLNSTSLFRTSEAILLLLASMILLPSWQQASASPGDASPPFRAVLSVVSSTATVPPPDSATLKLVADVPGSSEPRHLTVFDGALYFSAEGQDLGRELWRYDGSTPPAPVADIRPGKYGSLPSRLTVYDGALYFEATDGTTGNELWRYDGSSARQVADINSKSCDPDRVQNQKCSSAPSELTVYDGALYFQADDGKRGNELWRYDGSSVRQVADINSTASCDAIRDGEATTCSSFPTDLAVYNGGLYFQADDGKRGDELWRYDGSTVELVADINPNICDRSDCSGRPHSLTPYDGTLYFEAAGPDTEGNALWNYNGSAASRVTSPNAPDCATPNGEPVPCFQVDRFAQLNGTLYFGGADDRVWRHDGSAFERVALNSDVDSTLARPYRWITEYQGRLYYTAGDAPYTQLFAFDGTSVRQITAQRERMDDGVVFSETRREGLRDQIIFRGAVRHLATYDGALYFAAQSLSELTELWQYRVQ